MTPWSSTGPSRLLLTVAFTISALLLGIIGAVAAGTGTVAPPPKIAFVTTNANVAPDALTVGPMAGRLGAPLFITNSDNLNDDVETALVAYDADLIIVAGGPNTVTDGVLAQISAATGLAIKDIADTPSDGIVRVAGSGRDQTAVALSELIAKYNPKFLPTDATATDADKLDGKDSTAFLGATSKAADADKLDGMDSAHFASAPTRVVVPAAAFVEDGFELGTVIRLFGEHAITGTIDNYGCVTAPVHVPDGYVPSSMTVYGYDDDATSPLLVHLFAAIGTSAGGTQIASVESTSESPSFVALTDDTIGPLPAGSPLFYALTTCLASSSIQLRGVEVSLVEE